MLGRRWEIKIIIDKTMGSMMTTPLLPRDWTFHHFRPSISDYNWATFGDRRILRLCNCEMFGRADTIPPRGARWIATQVRCEQFWPRFLITKLRIFECKSCQSTYFFSLSLDIKYLSSRAIVLKAEGGLVKKGYQLIICRDGHRPEPNNRILELEYCPYLYLTQILHTLISTK